MKHSPEVSTPPRLLGLPLPLATLALAAIYFLASRLGFSLAFSAEQVTVVWPPTGIALAAVLLLGNRILPGIWLGAFLTNITRHEPALVALGIAVGNTIEAWLSALMMRRLGGFNISIGQPRDVLSLVVFSALCGTMLSANIGVATLCLGGVQPWADYGSLWVLWWLGDATGALVVAPVIMVWLGGQRRPFMAKEAWELAAMLTMLTGICFVIFTAAQQAGLRGQVFIYVIFPFVIWGALRFGQRGTTLVTLVSSAIAILFAAQGMSPFTFATVEEGLTLLQVFMAVVAVTGLFLGAAITERRRALDALKLADRRKNEFLAVLAHELRNPLSTLNNALFVLSQADVGEARAAEARAVMGRQIGQVSRLVDDLLDVSRITHGKFELRRERVALASVMSAALDVAKAAMKTNGHRLTLHIPREDIWLDADPARLTQVFINLMGNAAKYTPSGGHISVIATREPGKVIVRISDNGIGIPPSLLPHVFDMFTQADYSVERAQGGLGIGLTLVKKLVELHLGKVSVTSAGSFKGSEFTVELPVMETLEPTDSVSALNTVADPH